MRNIRPIPYLPFCTYEKLAFILKVSVFCIVPVGYRYHTYLSWVSCVTVLCGTVDRYRTLTVFLENVPGRNCFVVDYIDVSGTGYKIFHFCIN